MAHLHIETAPNHVLWRIDREGRGNAVGPTVARELTDALAALTSAASRPRALVLTAKPIVKDQRRTWIAGGDLKELAQLTAPADGVAYARSLADFLSGLDALPVPVLVALDGDAIGGGAELALGGDLRIATRSSRLIFRQMAIGLATGYGGARRLVELAGLARAQDLLLGARTLTAAEALALGLVHEVVDDEHALSTRIGERTAAWAALAPAALAAQKSMLWHAVRSHPGAARDAEALLFKGLWGQPAHRDALAAFASSTRPKP